MSSAGARWWRSPAVLVATAAVVLAAGTAGVAVGPLRAADVPDDWFVARPIPVEGGADLFDLAVADVDGDGWMDVVTANHNVRQDVLLGDGHLGFRGATEDLGLAQDTDVPGWDREAHDLAAPAPSTPAGPGEPVLAVERAPGAVVLTARPASGAVAAGTLTMVSTVEVGPVEGDAEVSTSTGTSPEGWRTTTVAFSAAAPARIVLRPHLLGVPLRVVVDAPLTPADVGVGPLAVRPPATAFTLELRDRHGLAFADTDADGDTDLFIARGGLKDELEAFPGLVTDQLLLAEGGRLVDATAGRGFVKGTCRGRQAAWVDLDADGRLDLVVGCHRASPQLWHQRPDGTFEDRSAALDAVGLGDGWVWTDLVGDRRPELVGAVQGRAWVFAAAGAAGGEVWRYERVQDLDLGGTGEVTRLAPGDVDGDGRPDLLVAGPAGSRLLRAGPDGRLAAQALADLGLPAAGVLEEWIDVDGDGRLDVLTWPGGIHRQGDDGRFDLVARLPGDPPTDVQHARASWIDGDGDGDRDLVLALARRKDRDWDVRWFENEVPGAARTAELELEGPPGNRPAIGAAVRGVVDGRPVAARVGDAEASRFSHGHHRLYVGTGAAGVVEDVVVTWPDGTETPIGPIEAGRVRVRWGAGVVPW